MSKVRRARSRSPRAAARPRAAGGAGNDRSIEIRMYDVGFGDSFLLFLPGRDRRRKVLIDCGSIKRGARPIKAVAKLLVAAAAESEADGKPHIDVVVATHRYRDHVSGFDDPVWANVKVDEVWMPWTEHPTDPEAKRIRDIQASLALQLTSALAAAGDPELLAVAENSLTNAEAMETLHKGFAGGEKIPRRFLPRRQQDRRFTTDLLPAATVHVMGPSRDPEVIRDMDPPAGGSYLRLRAALEQEGGVPDPFRAEWWMSSQEFARRQGPLARLVRRADRRRMRGPGEQFQQAVTVALDSAVNGTSLMLMFQIGTARLLFPGDAQWGTWERAMNDPEWAALIKATTFYKVGHHGSHNATPKRFVELFEPMKKSKKDAFWAMTSVRPVKKWKSVPRVPLLAALRERTSKLIRSDVPAEGKPVGFGKGDGYIKAIVPF